MSLESRQHMLETPRSSVAKAAVTTVAEVSSAHDVCEQLSPPPRFSSLGRNRPALLPLNCPRPLRVAARARTLPVRHIPYEIPRRATPWASNDAHYPHGPSLDGRCARWAGKHSDSTEEQR